MALSFHAPQKLTGISHSAGPATGPSATNAMLTFRFPADCYSHSVFCLNRSGGSRLDSKQKSESCNKIRVALASDEHWEALGYSGKLRPHAGARSFASEWEFQTGFQP